MRLSEICIKRPVLATVLSLIIIMLGVVSINYLHTKFLPTFQSKSIRIQTQYPGASAKLIETSITTPIEKAVAGIQGIDHITSSSLRGLSNISIHMRTGANIEQVANQIRAALSRTRDSLPTGTKSPEIKVGYGSNKIMSISAASDTLSIDATRDYLKRYVITRLEQIPGVSHVDLDGASDYAMRIILNPKKLAAHDLTAADVKSIIQESNWQVPAGSIDADGQTIPITVDTKLQSAKAFNNIVLKNNNGTSVHLRDVASVALGSAINQPTIMRINGRIGVGIGIYSTASANPIIISKKINALLGELKSQLPSTLHLSTQFDIADFMNSSIDEVYISIFIAIACVIIIIFLFLGRVRSAIIPLVTIPVCLLAAFAILFLFDLSINIISLLAIVLSIGLVVDDAIVMLENIHRNIELGLSPREAAIKGSREITFAVIAMTLTLAAVFAPVGFIQGSIQKLMQSFAYTLAGTVIVSGFIALTLTPMMCAKLFKPIQSTERGYSHWLDNNFGRLEQAYHWLLTHVLRVRWMIIIMVLAVAGAGFWFFDGLSKNFMPKEDLGFVVVVPISHAGISVAEQSDKMEKIRGLFDKNSAIANTTSYAYNPTQGNDNNSFLFVTMKPFDQRHLSANDLAHHIMAKARNIPELNSTLAFAPSIGNNSARGQLEFSLITPKSYRYLYQASEQIKKTLKDYPGLARVTTDLHFDTQEYKITINRALAGQLNVSIKAIDEAIANLMSGAAISNFDMAGQSYDVIMEAQPEYLHDINLIKQFRVANRDGTLIPLAGLITINREITQPSLLHYDRLHAATVYGVLAPDYHLGDVVHYLQKNLPDMLPADVSFAFRGASHRLLETGNSVTLLFVLALVFIYLILSAQFESFIDPFIILLAVPLSIVGAMGSLYFTGGSLNVYTQIGLITLIGLIAKHGILITEFSNQLQREGLAMTEALVKASSIRLRPILMTTAAMVFGALPLALASGASANSREQIATVIIGGLFFGTFFSLLVVPVAYSYAAGLKQKIRALAQRFKISSPG